MKRCEECKRKNSILMESKSRGKTERNRERENDRRKGGKEERRGRWPTATEVCLSTLISQLIKKPKWLAEWGAGGG
jgi:hypothetical protein